MRRADVIDLDQGLANLTDEEMTTMSGFRRTIKSGTELIVPPATITRLFADRERRKETAEIARFLKRDGVHFGRKRVVFRDSKKERPQVFAGFD